MDLNENVQIYMISIGYNLIKNDDRILTLKCNLKQEAFYNLLMFIKKRSANPIYLISALI